MIWDDISATKVMVGDTIIRNVLHTREFEDDSPYGAFFVDAISYDGERLSFTVVATSALKNTRDIQVRKVISHKLNDIVTVVESVAPR